MATILTYEDFKELGFRLSVNIEKKQIDRIIEDVENKLVKSNIDFYNSLTDEPDSTFDDALLILKKGIANVCFGKLLTQTSNVTRTGAVKKTTDFSVRLQQNEMVQESAEFFDTGTALIREGLEELSKLDETFRVKRLPYYNYFKGFFNK